MDIEFDKEYYIRKRVNCYTSTDTKYSHFGNILYDNEEEIKQHNSVFSTYVKLKFAKDLDGNIRIYMKDPYE